MSFTLPPNVTYLLGAGASYNAIPVVSEFSSALINLKTELDSVSMTTEIFNTPYADKSDIQGFDEFLSSLDFISSRCAEYTSIDTYAKKLFIQQRYEDIARTKATIALAIEIWSIGFIYAKNKFIEKRYDAFIASLIDLQNRNLPKQINIVSWNYDNLLSNSLNDFCSQSININNKLDEIHDSKILKINGSASITNLQDDKFFYKGLANDATGSESLRTRNKKQILIDLLTNFSKIIGFDKTKLSNCGISFAWEMNNHKDFQLKLERFSKSAHSSKYIVSIGYSFPNYNRHIDRQIFGNLDINTKFYINDPNGEAYKDKVHAITGLPLSQIEVRPEVQEFYIPDELL